MAATKITVNNNGSLKIERVILKLLIKTVAFIIYRAEKLFLFVVAAYRKINPFVMGGIKDILSMILFI